MFIFVRIIFACCLIQHVRLRGVRCLSHPSWSLPLKLMFSVCGSAGSAPTPTETGGERESEREKRQVNGCRRLKLEGLLLMSEAAEGEEGTREGWWGGQKVPGQG